MKTFIFVYSPTAFRVSGSYAVRSLDQAVPKTYSESPPVLEPGTGGTLARGIYGIRSDGDDVLPAIQPSSPDREAIDYDMVTIRDKDTWPRPPIKTAQLERIGTAFPTVPDTTFDSFMLMGKGQ